MTPVRRIGIVGRMMPTIGRIVIVRGKQVLANGSEEQPAMVTRAWSETCVNVTVMRDCSTTPLSITSVMLVETPDAAADYLKQNPDGVVAHWPARS